MSISQKNIRECLKHLFLVLILSILCCLITGIHPLNIQAESSASLSFSHEHPQAQIHLYYVASGTQDEGYAVQDRFAPVNPSFEENDPSHMTATARTLYSYISDNLLEPDYVSALDESGRTSLDGLDKGIYLATSPAYTHEESTYIVNPALVHAEEGNNPVVMLKPMMLAEVSFELSISKVWQDEQGNSIDPAVSSISLDVLKNGILYTSLVLGEDNNWMAQCVIDDPEAEWSVRETTAIDGFDAHQSQNQTEYGIDITLINQKKEIPEDPQEPEEPEKPVTPDPDNPSEPDNPSKNPFKNGPLNTAAKSRWDIPASGMAAAFLIGWLINRRKEKKNTGKQNQKRKFRK